MSVQAMYDTIDIIALYLAITFNKCVDFSKIDETWENNTIILIWK